MGLIGINNMVELRCRI